MAETMVRVTVTIPASYRTVLETLGDGNVSKGLRKALEELDDVRWKLAGWVRAHEMRPGDLEEADDE